MRVDGLELRVVRIPLVAPFRTSYGTDTHREAVIVRAITDGDDGWGECVAFDHPFYSAEFTATVLAVIEQFIWPNVDDLDRITGHPMAKAGVQMALLDARLRAAGHSLAEHLGVTRTSVPVGIALGLTADPGELHERIDAAVDSGYQRIKMKIEPGRDVAVVEAVRSRFGPDLMLSVDANGAYTDPAEVTPLDEFGLVMIEQPFVETDLLAHARLADRMSTPICLDESISSPGMARLALDVGACSIISIKPGRVGGLDEAVAIHDESRSRGVPVWCGGMLETGLGRAANLALAGLPGFTLPGDISATSRYFARDITPAIELVDGEMPIPTGPGIGIRPDADALSDFTVLTVRL